MTKLQITYMIIFTMLLSSCVGYYSDMSHLSDDELKWTDCYNVGDTIFFLSNNNEIDTLVVSYKKVENSNNPFYIHFIDDYKGGKYEAFSMYSFCIKGSADSIEGSFRIVKLAENDSIQFLSYLEDRFTNDWPFEFNSRGDLIHIGDNPIKVTSLKLCQREYQNCLLIDSSNSTLSKYARVIPTTIESYIISRDYGLMQYRMHNGDVFIRNFDFK